MKAGSHSGGMPSMQAGIYDVSSTGGLPVSGMMHLFGLHDLHKTVICASSCVVFMPCSQDSHGSSFSTVACFMSRILGPCNVPHVLTFWRYLLMRRNVS